MSHPAHQNWLFRTGKLVGPPPHKRITCAKCGERKGVPIMQGRQPRYCAPCRELVRIARGRAQSKVNKAVAKGILQPLSEQSCMDCGRQAACYDHRDYTKPLEVEPVCKRCNQLRGPAVWQPILDRYFLEPAPL